MTRATVTLCASILAGTAFTAWSGQVPVQKEPRHKQLLYTAHVRLFDVNIPAGGATLDHVHEHDVATVALGEFTSRAREAGKDWDAPRMRVPGSLNVTEYSGARRVHRVENAGTSPYRLLAVENDRLNGWTTPAAVVAPGTTLARESRAFALYEVRLDAATPQTSHTHEVPTVVALVSGSMTYQGGGGNDPFTVSEPGRWVFAPQGSPHTLSVSGGADARIVEFEAR